MTTYYDDNFGHYNPDGFDSSEDMDNFYRYMDKNSVWKICKQCGNKVKIKHDYAICNTCADNNERMGGY